MIEFLLQNPALIAEVIAAVLLIVLAIATRQWTALKAAALSLMLAAERLMATTEGRKKMDWVLAATWQRAPGWLKAFVSEDRLRTKLQEWYNAAKGMISE